MSRESQNSSLTTVALLIGVLAGLTTILGYLGWHPRWEKTTGSAEPPSTEPPKSEPPKSEPPHVGAQGAVNALAPVPAAPKERAVPDAPAKEMAAPGSAKAAAAAAPERPKERVLAESRAPVPPPPAPKEAADPEKDRARLGGKHRRNR